ncbi:mitochondrial intermembrane space import and assembly protein 40-B-like [Littorina saxatilis]|uniref:Mitochondrial intermembrane space import and assembly protein 40 n=1 Tax=Littorina saxatilis TaxID=31220 RepID=A0AAN9BAX7_9CAEN
MSYCRKEGKDEIIFATKEDLQQPSTAIIKVDANDEDEEPGLILPNGDINWNCPCLGGMASGPCGMQFREAFSCFHYSEAEPKGSDCYESFRQMQDCMQGYPELYPSKEDEGEGEAGNSNENQSEGAAAEEKSTEQDDKSAIKSS